VHPCERASLHVVCGLICRSICQSHSKHTFTDRSRSNLLEDTGAWGRFEGPECGMCTHTHPLARARPQNLTQTLCIGHMRTHSPKNTPYRSLFGCVHHTHIHSRDPDTEPWTGNCTGVGPEGLPHTQRHTDIDTQTHTHTHTQT
jgi:hypothetical protein